MARLSAILFVTGILLATAGTVYARDWFGWNNASVPLGEPVQVVSLVMGGALIAFGVLFTVIDTNFPWPRMLRRRPERLP